MSTRVLSAYFNDYRQGKKDFDLLRTFLLDTLSSETLRRGHLLHWLDQAQYQHPIPVTDFLLLRKEVEMALKSNWDTSAPAVDDSTVIATSAVPAEPNTDTLIVDAATHFTEATLIAQDATLVATRGDSTPLPERSDHAGQHEAATSFNPLRPAPQPDISPAPPRQFSPVILSPRYAIIAAVILIMVAAGAGVGLRLWLKGQTPEAAVAVAPPAVPSTPGEVNELLKTAPSGSIGGTAISPANSQTAEDTGAMQNARLIITPLPDLNQLGADELMVLIRERSAAGNLLPSDNPATAHAALASLEQRFPDSPDLTDARVILKDAHLAQSSLARSRGQWEEAQRHLDAAFDVLQTIPGQVSATAGGS